MGLNNKRNIFLESINTGNLEASSIHIDNFEVFTNENIANIVSNRNEVKSFDNVITIKDYDSSQESKIVLEENIILKESDVEVYRKNCIAKMKQLDNIINIYSSVILITDLNKGIKSNYDQALNNIGNDSELNSQIKPNLNEKYVIEDLKDINDRLTLSEINNSTFLSMNTSVSLSMSTYQGPMRKRKRKFRIT